VSLARIYVGAHLPLDVGGAALGLVIDAALTLVKEKVEPKGPCYRDLGPWPLPAGTDQRRIEHSIT
jgi:membrane-associated phospholipid phosphatase